MLVGLWPFYFAAMADAWCVCVLSRYLFSFIQNGKRRPRAVRPRHDSQSFARRPGAPRVMCKVKCVIVFSASQVLKTKNHLAVSQSQSFYHTPLARSSRPTLTLYFGLLSSVLTLYSGLLSSVRSHSTLVVVLQDLVFSSILSLFTYLLVACAPGTVTLLGGCHGRGRHGGQHGEDGGAFRNLDLALVVITEAAAVVFFGRRRRGRRRGRRRQVEGCRRHGRHGALLGGCHGRGRHGGQHGEDGDGEEHVAAREVICTGAGEHGSQR
eukprot:scaffold90571_cov63-Phaeocystis_antarctica.AAC.1